VWLDEIEMRVGDHLRRGIDRGVVGSRYAAVILSPAFFAKQWTQYELDGLVAREMSGEQIILPIWHNLTKDELLAASPSLADRIALSTANLTLEQIADELAAAVLEVSDPCSE
jgi:predicted RNase H-like nuclease